MGKKHKKYHRAERREGGYDETPEKVDRPSEPPLRLVLKVGKGSETMVTASPSSDHYSTVDSPATPDPDYRHSHHKKKKKKKKTEHDRKRSSAPLDGTPDPEIHDDEEEDMEVSEEGMEDGGPVDPPTAKKLLLAMHERRANPSRHCKDGLAVQEKRPLSKVLENLQKTLQRKDVDGFFAWPVNDIIAPGYSSIILRPMDFSTMKKKIEKEAYFSIDEYKADFVLMCENAMKYNRPETVYYKAARKLLNTGQKVMSTERLATIKRAFGCVEGHEGKSKDRPRQRQTYKHQAEKENFSIHERQDFLHASDSVDVMATDDGSLMEQGSAVGRKSEDDDDMDEDDAKVLIQEVLEAAKAAKDRLTARQPNSKIGFLRKDKAGTTTLAFLNPDREESEDSRKVNLGMLTGRLTQGTTSLQGFKEDKRNKALPVNYLMYGPFSSYAPQYDSSFSNLSKEESDLLYSTYGDEEGLKYSQSIQEYVKDSGDFVTKLVDNLLDSLTNGEHSKTKEQIKQNHEQGSQKEQTELGNDGVAAGVASQPSDQGFKIDYDGLRSLADEGIDISFLNDMEKELTSQEKLQSETKKEVDKKLGKTAELIYELERTQNERLGRKPPPHLQYVSGPSEQEFAIAEQLTQHLKELTAKTMPANLTTAESVRRAMGVTVEPVLDSPSSPSVTSHPAPSETTESSAMPDDNALPDDIAKELEAEDDVGTAGELDGKGDDDDVVDDDVGEELLELLRDKGDGDAVVDTA
ncbi:bromodomain-containing protein 7-like [Diadema antillarum]|uniref:bromodomain-containing protein 7-like n=1 Tax=Diadema antillarum TaxID=105358 RepID=UPI003A849BCC